jgi:16S rRNA C967 or C1407 C5-methylase (RsmB/RsmF family)
MTPQVLARDILNRIINENTPFSLALKQAFKKNEVSREDKANISAMVGCVLRHYLVLSNVISKQYPALDSVGVIALMIAFSNALFIKKLDQEDCNKEAQQYLKDEDVKVQDFIEPYLAEKKLVPENIEVGSFEFLSYRYNTPVDIIKMWSKQFGHIAVSKALKANSKPAPVVLRIDNKKIEDEDFFNKYPEFERIEGVNGMALYKGEGKFKNHEVSEKALATPYALAFKEMLDEGDVDLLRGLAIYTEYPNDLLIDLLSRKESISGVEFIAGNLATASNARNFLNKNQVRGVNVYEAQASAIITCLSKPVHTFVVMPDSSRFNLLQLLPDYFLRFDFNKLDELIANQKLALKEAAEQVEEDGYLLYLVDTLSKKESINIINEFLANNENFTLVRDKLYFPYKKYGGSYYFAALKKAKKND